MPQHKSIEPNFGKGIRNWREHNDVNQNTLAKLAGISNSLLSKIERGARLPSKSTALLLIDAARKLGDSDNDLPLLQIEAELLSGENSDTQIHSTIAGLNRTLLQTDVPNDQILKLTESFQSMSDIYLLGMIEAPKFNRDRKWRKVQKLIDHGLSKRDALFKTLTFPLYIEGAKSAYNVGDYEKALQLGLLARPHIEVPEQRITHQLFLGSIYRRRSQWEFALREIKKAEEKAQSDPTLLADCRRKRIAVYLFQSLAKKALELSNKTEAELAADDQYNHMKLKQYQGWSLSILGDLDGAIAKYEEVDRRMEELRPPLDKQDLLLERAKNARYLADVHRLGPVNLYPRAKELYQKALSNIEAIEKEKNTEIKLLRGMNYYGLASLYLDDLDQSDAIQKARELLDRSSRSFRVLNEPLGGALVYIQMGKLYQKLGDFENAQSFLFAAVQWFIDLNNAFYLGYAASSLCDVLLMKGQNKDDNEFTELITFYATFPEGRLDDFGELFPHHYAKMKSTVARAYLRHLGNFNKGVMLICSSTRDALSYNRYAFQNRVNDLLREMDFLKRAGKVDAMQVMGETYIEYWDDQLVIKDSDIGEVQKSKNSVQRIIRETTLVKDLTR